MPTFVLTGSDPAAIRNRVADLASAGGTLERFDLSVDGGATLVRTAQTGSLFTARRVLVASPAASLRVEHAQGLQRVAPDTTVVLTGDAALPVAVKNALPPDTQHTPVAPPSRRDAAGRVAALAQECGVVLADDAAAQLTRHAVEHWGRVRSVVETAATLGWTRLGAAHVEQLLGSTVSGATAWTWLDMILRGAAAQAVEVASHLEPAAALAYATKSLHDACSGATSGTLAHLSADVQRASWAVLAQAERDARLSRNGADALVCATVRLSALWSPVAATADGRGASLR